MNKKQNIKNNKSTVIDLFDRYDTRRNTLQGTSHDFHVSPSTNFLNMEVLCNKRVVANPPKKFKFAVLV